MRRMKYLPFGFSFLLMLSAITVGKEWRGIIPLHSTRNDVERLFGLSSYGGGYAYDFKNERVFFQYQYPDNECGKIWGRWDVPLNTVLEITVYPKNKMLFVDLKMDMSKFKETETDIPGSYRYFDKEHGISYAVDNGVVAQIRYLPSAKDKHLACPEEGKGN